MTTKPNPQYLSAEHVLEEMCAFGSSRLEHLSLVQLFVLGVMGGAFITGGALFFVLLSDGVEMTAAKHVLAGIGNMLCGALLVALPFWFALPSEHRDTAAANARAAARDSSSRKDAP